MHDPQLNERERKFVELFMGRNHGNATQAALGAGYAKKSARGTASRLLTKANIRHAIEDRVRQDPAVADRLELQRFFTAIVQGRGAHVLLKMRDRLRAAELLGKSHKMFADVLDVNVFDHAKYLASDDEPADGGT